MCCTPPPDLRPPEWQVHVTDSRHHVPLADSSVHCAFCSPPYWGQRDYNDPAQIGLEEIPDCLAWARHEPPCTRCYICALRLVFAEVARVLRDDGTLWVNLADGYCTRPNGGVGRSTLGGSRSGAVEFRRARARRSKGDARRMGLKHKDGLSLPARLQLALTADGWYYRGDCIWDKTAAMPESAVDRPTRSHEPVLLFTRSERYSYDRLAVMEPARGAPRSGVRPEVIVMNGTRMRNRRSVWRIPNRRSNWTYCSACKTLFTGRDRRSIPVRATGEDRVRTCPVCSSEHHWVDHHAQAPARLAEIPIRAGTSAAGCCPSCLAPWKRVLHRSTSRDLVHPTTVAVTAGWAPNCPCDAGPPIPCRILDPFCGASNTGLMALRLGRDFTGCDVGGLYVEASMARLRHATDPAARARSRARIDLAHGQLALFQGPQPRKLAA